jgi:imidazole glycerol-phosphate synthase subunit HisF
VLLPRITPCLLVHNGGLVKTLGFKAPKYVGDPINAVKIFNEKEVDELIVLDIDSTVNNLDPNYALISKLAAECRMPLCYGGGIKTTDQAKQIISLGVEKIAISSSAIENTGLISSIAKELGSQSVVVVLDLRKKSALFKTSYEICTHNGTKSYKLDLMTFVKQIEKSGAGEILINSIDNDGLMSGYNLQLAKQLQKELKIPMTFLGGAGSLNDIKCLFDECGIIGAAAGSMFVFKGKYKAVLISYPNNDQRREIFDSFIT